MRRSHGPAEVRHGLGGSIAEHDHQRQQLPSVRRQSDGRQSGLHLGAYELGVSGVLLSANGGKQPGFAVNVLSIH
jgi:hypothetical protein